MYVVNCEALLINIRDQGQLRLCSIMYVTVVMQISTKPWPIMLKFLPISYAFEQCSKKVPIMLNIMPISTALCHSSSTIL